MTGTNHLSIYQGKCHCGKFTIEFEHKRIEDALVTRCNCSMCKSRGYLLVYPSVDQLKFTKGSLKEMTSYRFGEMTLPHHFCPTCGIGLLADGGEELNRFAVNIRCVDGIDWKSLAYRDVDGASL